MDLRKSKKASVAGEAEKGSGCEAAGTRSWRSFVDEHKNLGFYSK